MRMFLGTPVPPGAAFDQVTQELRDLDIGARPVPPGSWHVTLRFFGDLADPGPVEAAIDRVLVDQPAVPVRVQGVGAFKDARNARIVWAGVEADGLGDVKSGIAHATAGIGEPPQDRTFRPHATLARIKRPTDLRTFIGHHRDTRFSEGCLDEVVLWRSDLGPSGPAYTPVRTWRLQSL